MTNDRLEDARVWIRRVMDDPSAELQPLAGDASFRRYFRVQGKAGNRVLMDALPPKEDVRPFLRVREWLAEAGVRVPSLIGSEVLQGFLLLEDFGDITWAAHLSDGGDVAPLFADALRQLHALQSHPPVFALSLFDVARMRAECNLYIDWYLPHVAFHTPSAEAGEAFHAALAPLLWEIARLPRVPVHLDYHSRNLMLPDGGMPLGVIDFQDAVMGPVTYDLASLLYDCYQAYPELVRQEWSRHFFEAMPQSLQEGFANVETWHRAVRLTALQRHIKAIGIFSRLAFRDGKRQFLREIPLTRKHLREEIDDLGMKGLTPLLSIEPV